MTGPARRPPSSSRRDLADAYEHAVHSEAGKRVRAAIEKKRSRTRLFLMCIGWGVALAGVATVALRPQWFGIRRQVETAAERDANVRLSLYVAGRQLEAYKKTNGQFPEKLEDVGKFVPGIQYQRRPDGGYEMRLSRDGHIILLTSKDPLSAFIGPSLARVVPRGKP